MPPSTTWRAPWWNITPRCSTPPSRPMRDRRPHLSKEAAHLSRRCPLHRSLHPIHTTALHDHALRCPSTSHAIPWDRKRPCHYVRQAWLNVHHGGSKLLHGLHESCGGGVDRERCARVVGSLRRGSPLNKVIG
jgi:hypothetical protein